MEDFYPSILISNQKPFRKNQSTHTWEKFVMRQCGGGGGMPATTEFSELVNFPKETWINQKIFSQKQETKNLLFSKVEICLEDLCSIMNQNQSLQCLPSSDWTYLKRLNSHFLLKCSIKKGTEKNTNQLTILWQGRHPYVRPSFCVDVNHTLCQHIYSSSF